MQEQQHGDEIKTLLKLQAGGRRQRGGVRKESNVKQTSSSLTACVHFNLSLQAGLTVQPCNCVTEPDWWREDVGFLRPLHLRRLTGGGGEEEEEEETKWKDEEK